MSTDPHAASAGPGSVDRVATRRAAAALRRRSRRAFARPEVGILIPLLVLGAVFYGLNSDFALKANLLDILRESSFTFIVCAGTTLVFAAGGLDLSVGSVAAFGGIVAGLLMHDAGWPVLPAIVLAVLAGGTLGAANGIASVRLGVPPLIVTLGMLYIARGLVNVITQGAPVYPLPQGFTDFVQGDVAGIPNPVIVAVAVGGVAHVVLTRTTVGRAILAVGGNEAAARLAGISVNRYKVVIYVVSAMTAALAGALLAGKLSSAQPGTGTGMELSVIAAVIIGGTSMFGGSATVVGSALGALLIGTLTNGLVLSDVSPFWQNLVVGVVIVAAVAIDQWKRRRPVRVPEGDDTSAAA
jgi:ribose/xylose/arabinose/galactoside ABC-type transport system permease subunit